MENLRQKYHDNAVFLSLAAAYYAALACKLIKHARLELSKQINSHRLVVCG